MFEQTKDEIGKLGFQVVATEKHSTGVSFDAHFVLGKRFMVRGDVMPNDEMAMTALLVRCSERMR